jgi:hypothetical protein
MPNRDQMWGPMSLEDYADRIGEDLSQRPVALSGLDVLPDIDAPPGEPVTLRAVRPGPGTSAFDPHKGILATRPAVGRPLSQAGQPRRPGFAEASDISGHMDRFIEGQRGVVKAAVDGGKEIAGATDELGTARRVLGGLTGANIGLTVAGEAFGLADDLKRGVPARVAVPGAVAHGAASGAAAVLGGAAGGFLGTLIPIPGVGTALGAAAGSIAAGWAADKFGPTREHYGWEIEKIRKGR